MSEEITTSSNPLDDLQAKINQYQETIKNQADNLDVLRSRIRNYQDAVREFFQNHFDSGEEDANISRDEANDLLDNIGAAKLTQEYEGQVVVSFSFKVNAEDAEEAERIVESAFDGIEHQIDCGSNDEYSMDSVEVNL